MDEKKIISIEKENVVDAEVSSQEEIKKEVTKEPNNIANAVLIGGAALFVGALLYKEFKGDKEAPDLVKMGKDLLDKFKGTK